MVRRLEFEDGRGSLGQAATLRFPSPLIEPGVDCFVSSAKSTLASEVPRVSCELWYCDTSLAMACFYRAYLD
jgi:hypothetical protein